MGVKLIHTWVTTVDVRLELLLLRYECEAHSHLNYCYVMGVKLICILNYECEEGKGGEG